MNLEANVNHQPLLKESIKLHIHSVHGGKAGQQIHASLVPKAIF